MISYFIEGVGVILVFLLLGLIIYHTIKYKPQSIDETITVEKSKKTNALLMCVILVLAHKIVTMAFCGIFFGNPFGEEIWHGASDIPHYIDIAKDGYVTEGFNAKWIVFFPLYPYILSIFGKLTGEYFWTGSILSMIFLILALFVFFITVEEKYGFKIARRTLIIFMLYPTVFFATLPMSEGLFLLLLALFLRYVRQRKFLISAIIGALCAFTRSVGAMLVFPLCVEAFLMAKERGAFKNNFWFFVKKSLYCFIIPIGTLAYLFINYKLFGNAFQFQIFQREYWSQSIGFFGNTIYTLVDYWINYTDRPINFALWGVQIIIIFAFIIIMLLSRKRRPSENVFSFSIFIFSISAQWLLSAPRYLMCLLPCFEELGVRTEKKAVFIPLIIGMSALSIYCLYQFLAQACIY